MEGSQKEFELLIKQSPVAITLMEGESLLLKVVNEAALVMMGKTEPEVKGKSLSDVFPELNDQLNFYKSVYESGLPFEGKEVELKFSRHGEIHTGYYDLNFKPWHDSDGNVKGVMGVCVDVSNNVCDRKKMEERERLYEAITQNTPDLIYVFDLNFRFTYANDALLSMLGRTLEESIGKSLLEIGYEPWQAELHEGELAQVIATKKPVRGEIPFPHASLGMRRYDYIFVPVIDQDGQVESIAGTTRDITDIKETQENLKESEERFRTFSNNIQNLAWIADGDGHIFWYNQRWLDYTGLTLEETKGWGWNKVNHPDLVDRITVTVKKFWTTNKPFEITLPLRRHDGQFRWFLSRAVPITDEHGKVYRWIGTNTDIHDRIETEEKLKESEQRYNNLIFSSPSGIGLLQGEDYVITTANDPMIEILGRGKEIIGKKYFEALPELAEQGYKEIFAQVYTSGKPYNAIETPVWLFQNGEKIMKYYNFILYPQRNIKNEVDGIGIIATDVTSQALLNNKVKESENRFALMVEQAPIAICVLRGENFEIEIANQKQLEIWGKTKEQVIDLPLFTAIPEGADQGFEELLSGVYETGDPVFHNELPYTLPRNGSKETFYANFVYKPLYHAEGKIEGVISIVTDVTEQVLARKKIEQSEAKYKSLIESAPMAIGIFRGRDLIIESPNEAFIQTVGKGPDIEGKRLTDVMPELKEQGQPYLKILNDVFNTGIMYWSYGDRVKIVKNGVLTESYHDISYVPLFDEEGNVYAILDIAADVTEKIEAHRKIEESEKRFRELADDSPIFVFIIEPNEEVIVSYWNKTWLRYTGQSMEEAIERGWKDIIHKDDVPSVLDIYDTAFTHRQPYFIPAIRTKRYDGEFRWFSYKGIPRYLPDGSFIGYVGVGFDVHEQKLAETILSEREEKFRSLVQTLPQLVLVTDHNGTVEFASFRWKEYTGIDLVGAKEWMEIVHPEDLDGLGAAWMEGISSGRFNAFDVRLKSKSGDYMWFTVKGEPVHDTENNIIKWVGAFTETHAEKLFTKELESKVKERTEELEQFNLELERKNKELQTFAYISSHDLQEPLRKIQTFASRIIHKEYDTLSENGKDNFKRMQDAAHRMQTLIQDLLAYSRTNTKERNFEKIDLNAIIDEIKEDLSEELKDSGASIETINLGYANVIPVQFRQLLQNLISNSLKFSIADNPPHIIIKSEIGTGLKLNTGKLSPKKMYCHISVSDNGIGFDTKYSEKIFEVFQRLHGRNEYKGTGIGLSIVKKIVENHEGVIIANGQANKGATFDIYIPA